MIIHLQDIPVPPAPHPICRRHRYAAEAVQEAVQAHQRRQVRNQQYGIGFLRQVH